ncbi:hypothetical protein [Bilophila wadsworthia]|uniref:hypothetical protein n=1 Tax=Bilophila wadsworthia TaxID=35833 RepID=UPI003AB6E2A6
MGTEAGITGAGKRGKPVFCPVSEMRGTDAQARRICRGGDFPLEQAGYHEEVQKEIEMKELILLFTFFLPDGSTTQSAAEITFPDSLARNPYTECLYRGTFEEDRLQKLISEHPEWNIKMVVVTCKEKE